jgi:PAS domain S-box-containing protein
MPIPATSELLHNATLLLALVVVYDLLAGRHPLVGQPLRQALVGLVVAGIGIGVMLAPLGFEPGILFDTRSVLLTVSGAFLGTLPTAVAMGAMAACRLVQGGSAAWTGVGVILASGGIGIAWRRRRRAPLEDVSWQELYGLGLIVHVVMLALMLTLPRAAVWRVLRGVALPVLLIYPLATAVLGALLANRLRRERASALLEDSAGRYRSLFENNHAVMLLIDARDGAIVDANPAASRFYGWTRAELQAMHITQIDTAPSGEVRAGMGARDARLDDFLFQHRRADGSLADVELIGGPITIQGRQLLYSIVHDVSGRRRVETALRESEEELRALFETASVGMAQADVHSGRWLRVNGKMCEIAGYPADELLRMHVPELTHPEDRERDWQAFQRVVRGEASDYRLEKRYIRGDGTHVWVNVNMTVTRDADGRPLRTVATIEDISERKRAEQEARDLLAAAEQSRRALLSVVEDHKRAEEERQRLGLQLADARRMESVGRLAGGVAHDFNNALGIILGHAELALNAVEPGDRLRRDLGAIREAAMRSANLTRQLLAFARQQTIAPKVLDLNHEVGHMLTMLRRLIGEDIQLTWMPGAGLWPVKMDPAQLDQVLANLLVNARDAIGGVGRITVETRNAVVDEASCARLAGGVPGEYVLLAVRDDGRGMDKDVLEHLFEPFFTTKEVGRGTGLGLATVYGIVQQNSGLIDVHSEPGQGAAFSLYLPRTIGEVPATDAADAVREPRGHGETILLVEDEQAMLEVGAETLAQLGYSVLSAGAPHDAVRIAQAHAGEIDLVITDVVMPGMNGRQLEQRLRELRPGIRCLFVSGYTADVIAHRGVLDEGVRFLQKPFSRLDLAVKVRQALEG